MGKENFVDRTISVLLKAYHDGDYLNDVELDRLNRWAYTLLNCAQEGGDGSCAHPQDLHDDVRLHG